MAWNRWYAARSYLRSTLWLIPLTALALEQVAIRLVAAIDRYFYWVPELASTVAATVGEMDTVVTMTMSFIVFTFGSMLVALQVASGQLTPRIIATTLLQDNTIRFTVGLFVFSLLFAAGTRARIDTDIPRLAANLAVLLGIVSVMAFLYLIDYTARLLRPVSIVWRIGEQGIEVIESVYPKNHQGESTFPRLPAHVQVFWNARSSIAESPRSFLPSTSMRLLQPPAPPTARSSSFTGSGISYLPAIRCFGSTEERRQLTIACCGHKLPSGLNAPLNRIPPSLSVLLSTWQSKRSRKQSTIPQPPCLQLTNYIDCCVQ